MLAVDTPVDLDFIRRRSRRRRNRTRCERRSTRPRATRSCWSSSRASSSWRSATRRHSKLTIAEKDLPALKEKAVRYLFEHQRSFEESVPSDAELKELIELALGREITDEQYPELKSEASFDDYPLFLARWAIAAAGAARRFPGGDHRHRSQRCGHGRPPPDARHPVRRVRTTAEIGGCLDSTATPTSVSTP